MAGEVIELSAVVTSDVSEEFRGTNSEVHFFFRCNWDKPYNFLFFHKKKPQHHKNTFSAPIGLPLTLIRGCL